MGNATLELVLTVVVIGGLGAVSPTRFALSVVMLTDPTQPWPRALGFAVGSTAVFAAAVLLGLLGVQAPGGQEASDTINVVLGGTMIVVAIVMTLQRRRPTPVSTYSARHPFLTATGVGAGVAFQSFGRLLVLVAAGFRIGLLSGSAVTAIGAAIAMIVLWQAAILAPMALYIFRRPRFDALAKRARPAIDRAQGGWYGAALIAAFGVYLIYRGLQG